MHPALEANPLSSSPSPLSHSLSLSLSLPLSSHHIISRHICLGVHHNRKRRGGGAKGRRKEECLRVRVPLTGHRRRTAHNPYFPSRRPVDIFAWHRLVENPRDAQAFYFLCPPAANFFSCVMCGRDALLCARTHMPTHTHTHAHRTCTYQLCRCKNTSYLVLLKKAFTLLFFSSASVSLPSLHTPPPYHAHEDAKKYKK